MKTLDNLQAGDLVIYKTLFVRSIIQVQRVTPTSIVTQFGAFRKKDGYKIGNTDPYSHSHISIATDEEIKEIKQRDTINDIIEKVKRILNTYNITYEQAIQLKELFNIKL
jgi:hypothetical protein